jgi:sec-independent protein translocase protein TatA
MPDGLFANPLHWAILLVIVLIVFGPGKLPGVGKALGQSLREFKKASQEPGTPEASVALAGRATPSATEGGSPAGAELLCSNCGGTNSTDAQYCGECGTKLDQAVQLEPEAEPAAPPSATLCSTCQTENPPGNRFCAHCGRMLDAVVSRV